MLVALAVLVGVIGILLAIKWRYGSIISQPTVQSRIEEIITKKPYLADWGKNSGGELQILVFKKEKSVEVWAPGWEKPLTYPMTAFSGELGPKLKEGDRQIPEGIYDIEYLNPHSKFYLSMKVGYPNSFDRKQAEIEKRTQLGGDIMIHGKAATIGCVPIGDEAVEELFYLTYFVGIENVKVIISPYDLRQGRDEKFEKSSLSWYGELLDSLERELSIFIRKD